MYYRDMLKKNVYESIYLSSCKHEKHGQQSQANATDLIFHTLTERKNHLQIIKEQGRE